MGLPAAGMAGPARDAGYLSRAVPLMGWEARYIGRPYVRDGYSAGGYHCWSLIRAVFHNECRINLESYGDVSATDLMKVVRRMEEGAGMPPFVHKVADDDRCPFDVVVMQGRERLANGKPGRMR